MPTYEVNAPDGKKYRVNAPDGASQDDAIKYVQTNFYAPKEVTMPSSAPADPTQNQAMRQKLESMPEPNWFERQIAKLPTLSAKTESTLRGFAMGAADPSVGLVQLGANIVSPLLPSEKNLSSLVTGQPKTLASTVNNAIAAKEREYEAGRAGAGRDGLLDMSRLTGNFVAPANLIAASKIAPVVAGSSRVAQGAVNGLFGGLSQPVTDSPSALGYFGEKAGQTALGAVTGSVISPVVGKIGDVLGRKVAAATLNSGDASVKTDKIVADALKEVGQSVQDMNPAALASLRQQVIESLQQGKKLDVAAAMRKADFDALGMPALRGQITRDPTQFAKEMNLRGVLNVGEPIQQRMDQQAQILQNKIGQYAQGATEAYPAGVRLVESLGGADKSLQKNVSALYNAARNSAGKDLDVPLQGLAQDYADVLSNFGDKVPSGVRNQFEALGLSNGVQKKVFTVESADHLLKTINANVSNDPATNRALDVLRASVKSAVTSADDSGGVFAPAVKAAAQRFKLHEAIPSLEAAANGTVAPDDFVRKFVINGKTDEVRGMAKLLQQTDPDAFKQARAQIGAEIQRAAFGENTALDKAVSPDRLAKTLRTIGKDKLSAFYSPEEIDQMHTIARVSAYRGSLPSNSAVNFSNSGSAVINLLGRIPGAPAAISLANTAKNAINNDRIVRGAVSADIPISAIDIPDNVKGLLGKFIAGGSILGGGLLAGGIGK